MARLVMRILFLLIFLAGTAAGLAYPWTVTSLAGREIGTWRVYERGRGFRPIVATLASADAPVRVLVDLTAVQPLDLSSDRAVLTIAVTAQNETVLAGTLSFASSTPRETSPQLPERIYREDAGTITAVEDGAYTFTLDAGDAEGLLIRSVDLVLSGGGGALDERVQPVGFSLMAIGFIGLVLSLRRGRSGPPPQNPNSQPPPPRWGRGGGRG